MSKTREYFFIGDRGQGEGIEIMGGLWKFIFKYAVLTASHFEAHFPNDPHLGEGRDEFLQLPKIKVEPWNGMKGAIAVKGEMTPEARALFLQIIETQFILLWDFMLFKDEQNFCRFRIIPIELSQSISPETSWRSSFTVGLNPYRSRIRILNLNVTNRVSCWRCCFAR